jgi:arylsulfatase
MLGTRGIWHEGWFANTVHAAAPSGWSNFDEDPWELYHIAEDRSQCRNLAAQHPEKLAEMQKLWFAEAEKYNGMPLADFNMLEVLGRQRPSLAGDRSSYIYYPNTAAVPLGACVNIAGRSFSVLAEVTVESPDVRGVLLKQGAGHGGYTLFVADGRLHFVYNFFGEIEQKVSSPDPVPSGRHILGVGYARTGTVAGSFIPLGEVTLYVDGAAVASLPAVKTHPFIFGLAGGGVSVGRNLGQPVSRSYQAPFEFTGGTIARVVVDVSGTPYIDSERQLALAFARD